MTRSVLIVDDDYGIRLIATRALEKQTSWHVLSASSGDEALQTLQAGCHVDAVVLDVMMPGMDGPTMLARVREQPATAELQVVMLTAKAQPDETEKLRRLPVSGVLVKPFDPLTLPQQLADLLGWQLDG